MSKGKTMVKFSVLVAVYNAEKYLKRCLDSLSQQTLKDIQVICVDDASTDNSSLILKEHARRDSRFFVLSLDQNYGPGHARNAAMQYVEGEYVCFVDSDDWLDCETLEKAYSVFVDYPCTDCVLFDVIYHYDDASKDCHYPMEPFDVKSGYDAFCDSLTWKIHGVYAVRSTIQKHYPYDETCRIYSDDNTTRIHYYVSREVRRTSGIYYYYQNPSSVTHRASTSQYDYLIANRSMKCQLLSLGVSLDIINIYENVMWLNVVDLYMFYYLHRRKNSLEENRYGMSIIYESWKNIEYKKLTPLNRYKFGYNPLPGHWKLFRLEEECYFFLKRLFRRYH